MNELNLVFPARVLRGAGVLNQLGAACALLGQRALLIGGHKALKAVEQTVQDQLRLAGVNLVAQTWFGGETSLTQIDRLAIMAKELEADLIIGAGGGKSLDTCKAVAAQLGLPVVTLPTIPATCSAVTPLTIRYDDDGNFYDIYPLPQAPAAVFIDSELLTKAPARWLAAGLGDTLAKWYEFRAVSVRHPAQEGNALSSLAHSRICYDIIAGYGPQAYQSVLRHENSAALDQVLDAIFTWAGLTSLMSNGAHAAAAHALYEGFTFCDKTREFGHGLLVGFGNLCLLALENRPDDELIKEIKLAQQCGIPLTLADIAALNQDELALIVKESVCAPDMASMAAQVTEADLYKAIGHVEQVVSRL
ncbi:iron-containing alcohol dehydrogenase family protein [Pantoea vagans]|uniref:iron-containing alcohol dehydrogenase family protein n=1 Tax=Pantoea vagans TaxID=470934 RepID=UPI0023AFE699|nr:iron-containing alcohol dehydrogenase family protein [Pantoea vagans]MDE8556227.1 iron-containing alcohol dehydrogenase family protein [Pantoea vagans]MDE8576278.1 iron-containing alcohol dehydrogenase family protein [Pantoea vagans]